MATDFKFKKSGIDTFTTSANVYDKSVEVSVRKNGNRWIAKFESYTAIHDTKRFAVLELQKKLRKNFH